MTSYSQRPTLIPHFSCPHTLLIALETAPLKIKQQVKKPSCFLPWLVANIWQNKSLDWEIKAVSVFIPCHTKVDSWPAVGMGGFRRNAAICALHPELLAAACKTGLEQSQMTGCWHCFLVSTVKKTFNLYALPYVYNKFPWPRQDWKREPSHVPWLGSSLAGIQASSLPWSRWHSLTAILCKCSAFRR